MATVHTALTGTPLPNYQEPPDITTHLMTAVSSLERYCNIPVPNATDRNTLIPTGNRVAGMVTYNVDRDQFEYWDGAAWHPVNRNLNMPASFLHFDATDYNVGPNGHHNYTYQLTITRRCQVLLVIHCNVAVSLTTNQWQGIDISPMLDGSIGTRTSSAYHSASGSGTVRMEAILMERFMLNDAKTYTFGMHVTCRNTSGQAVTLTNGTLFGLRIDPAANANAGSNSSGNW